MRWVVGIAIVVAGLLAWRLRGDGDVTPRTPSERSRSVEEEPARLSPPGEEESVDTAPTLASYVALVGTVVDDANQRIAGAQIEFTFRRSRSTTAISRKDGTFRLVDVARPMDDVRHGQLEISKKEKGLAQSVPVRSDSPEEIDLGLLTIRKVENAREIVVFAHEPDGTPVANIGFFVRRPTGHPFGESKVTGADGKATFRGLSAKKLEDVYRLDHPTDTAGTERVGTVDLRQGNGFVDVVVYPERELLIRVELNGRPGLPRRYKVAIDGVVQIGVREDRSKGELRLQVRPRNATGSVEVQLTTPRFQAFRAQTSTDLLVIRFVRGGVLTVSLRPPRDDYFALVLQRWNTDKKVFQWTGIKKHSKAHAFRSLPTGRYRVFDHRSGKMSKGVDVTAGAESTVVLDLSGAGWVRGTVKVPKGYLLRDARIEVERVGLVHVAQAPLTKTGGFLVRVPDDREILIRATHPLLAPELRLVSASTKNAMISLRAGALARLEFDKPIGIRAFGDDVRVLLFEGEIGDKPVASLRAKFDNKTITLGGFNAGTYTLWIDANPFVPIVVRNVTLRGDVTNNLGRFPTRVGSSIRLRVLVKPRQVAPRMVLSASSVQEPLYHRSVNPTGGAEVVLRGLGAGTFRVYAGATMSIVRPGMKMPKRLRETIELDGTNEHVLTFDLRGD